MGRRPFRVGLDVLSLSTGEDRGEGETGSRKWSCCESFGSKIEEGRDLSMEVCCQPILDLSFSTVMAAGVWAPVRVLRRQGSATGLSLQLTFLHVFPPALSTRQNLATVSFTTINHRPAGKLP